MANYTQPLSAVCDISVTISPVAAAAPSFNVALIVGNSGRIPALGGSGPRIREYPSTTAMLSDGFQLTDPEYIAAQLYFSQSPAPQYLCIGCQEGTAAKTVVIHSGSIGTGYVVGDVLTITQTNAQGAQVRVSTIGSNGTITGLTLVNQGFGYSAATALVTTGGTGTGAQVDITAIGETPLQALQACRSANASWYLCMVTSTQSDADIEAIAAWAEAQSQPTCYFFTTAEAAVLTNPAGSIFGILQALLYSRTLGIYSTTQSGLYPNNAYSAAAIMGYAMGANTGLAGSAYDLMFKPLVGVAAEPITFSQFTSLKAVNGNAYVNYANVYNWLEPGIMSNGQHFDEIIGIDMLVSDIEISVVDLFAAGGLPKVPQDNAGQSLVVAAATAACGRSADRGFIAPGAVWTGPTILNLKTGDSLPSGYKVQSESFTAQSPQDRAARKGMPVYVSIIEDGSIESIIIGVSVQR